MVRWTVVLVMGAAWTAGLACSERRPAPAAATDPDQAAGSAKPSTSAEQAQKTGPSRIKDAFPPQVAGGFYPGNGEELRSEVERFIQEAPTSAALADRDIVGVLSPHAGYRYSGPVAGAAYRAVQGRPYRTVVVLALSHRRAADKATTLARPAYDTPLGSIPIDQNAARSLLAAHPELFETNEEAFREEHSLEVQLPFVQVALPAAKILPIVVALRNEERLAQIGKALFESLATQGDVLFVVSSDLSHFNTYDQAKVHDEKNLGLLEKWKLGDWTAFAQQGTKGMCGFGPMLAFAKMFEGFAAPKRGVVRLSYQNSGDTTGDRLRVVGYGALAFTVEKGMREKETDKKDFGPYSAADRRALMDLAKRAVTAAAKDEAFRPETPSSALLKEKGAAFVTLKKRGDLRGCIGHVIARLPLFECIADVARSAAIHDTRFNKVAPDELSELSYEISVLTAPRPTTPDQVVVGRDGLIMSRGGRSGLLLPQVPVEWGWDKAEFLEHTCRKAGLSQGCWREPDTKIESFQAIVWGEEDLDD